MKMPSVENFNVIAHQMPDSFQQRRMVQVVQAMEKHGKETLDLHCAYVGAGVIHGPSASLSTLINYWILRHNDYDNGQANVEVHMRWIDPTDQGSYVTTLKDDVISNGQLGEYFELDRYVRVRGQDGLTWYRSRSVNIETADREVKLPAVRVPLLFLQCGEMALELNEWLRRNVDLLRDVSDEQKRGFLLEIGEPLLMAARGKLSAADKQFHRKTIFHWKRDLSRQNRIATPQHYELYDRLKRSLDFIKEERAEPLEREISLSSLRGLRTRWTNEIAEVLEPFL